MRLLLLLLLLAGLNPLLRAVDPSAYCPIAEGMEWTMDAKVTTPDGQVIETTAHRTIGAKEERDGKTYYRMKTWIDNVPQLAPFASLERREANALYSIDLRDVKPKEVISMELPFVVGKKWTRDDGKSPVTMEVLALEDITINGKIYKDCYKIKAATKDGNYTEEMWQAPGLGSIKSDVVLAIGAKISLTLREFKPGKNAK